VPKGYGNGCTFPANAEIKLSAPRAKGYALSTYESAYQQNLNTAPVCNLADM